MPNRYQGAAPSGHAAQQQFMQQGQQQIQQRYGQPIQAAQYQVANMPGQGLPGGAGRSAFGFNVQAHDANRAIQDRLAMLQAGRAQAQAQLPGQAFAAGELGRRDDVRDELFGRARGAIDDVPITDQVRDAMLSQGADQGAAMERSQLAGMGAMGARPGDPAFEAMRMQTGLGRQQGAQAMTRDMAIQQQLMNHAHRQQADRRLQELLAGEEFGVSLPTRQLSLQDYMRMRGG